MLQIRGELVGGDEVQKWILSGSCIPQIHGTETSGYFSTFWETLTSERSGKAPMVDTPNVAGMCIKGAAFYPYKESVTESKYENQILGNFGFPNYDKGIDIRNTDGSITGWTAPEDGWLSLGVRFLSHYGILLRADDLDGTNIVKIGGTLGHDYQIIPINKGDVLKYFHVDSPSWIDSNEQADLLDIWHLNSPYTKDHVTKDNIKYAMFFPCKQSGLSQNGFYDWSKAITLRYRVADGSSVTNRLVKYKHPDKTTPYLEKIDNIDAILVNVPVKAKDAGIDILNDGDKAGNDLGTYVRKLEIKMRGQMWICKVTSYGAGLCRDNVWKFIPLAGTADGFRSLH